MESYYLLIILVALVSGVAAWRFKSKYKKYSEVPLSAGLSGKEIAEKMLQDNGIYDVHVVSAEGMLSDHYNPLKKTVNLSADVYNGRSVASAAVAAHECGHAVQHAKAYAWLSFRTAMVPAVGATSKIVPYIIIAGLFTYTIFPELLLVGILLFALTTLFSFVTLPVEFDASRRALAWLDTTNLTYGEEHQMAKDALKWAASTYVISAIASLAYLVYYISIFLGRRD